MGNITNTIFLILILFTSSTSFCNNIYDTDFYHIDIETIDGREEPPTDILEYKFKQVIGENIFRFNYDIPIEFSCDELEIFDLDFLFNNEHILLNLVISFIQKCMS